MKRQKVLLLVCGCALIGGTAVALNWLHKNQKLGVPGIKAVAQTGRLVMKIDLPENVLDFTSTNVPEPEDVLDYLPSDTSYDERIYIAQDGFWIQAAVVLMGLDRTSIHKPEYCLPGQGWRIDQKANANLSIGGAQPYQMPVAKWLLSKSIQMPDGRKQEVRGLYVFWFVARNEETTSHWQRVKWMTLDLLRTGVLQRWAYVSYYAVCAPGQEDAAFERMKPLIAASVPEFQLPPPNPER
jgi:Protein of unknown function (DUF3485)